MEPERVCCQTPAPMSAPVASAARPVHLSPRELQVARLVPRGLADKEIAAELNISPRTVASYLSTTFLKVRVRNRAQLVAWLYRNHLLPIPPAAGMPGLILD